MKEFFLIMLAILILFRVFRRFIFISVIKAVNNQAMKSAQQAGGYEQHKPEGTVTIDNSKNAKSVENSDEYVDYEEVK